MYTCASEPMMPDRLSLVIELIAMLRHAMSRQFRRHQSV